MNEPTKDQLREQKQTLIDAFEIVMKEKAKYHLCFPISNNGTVDVTFSHYPNRFDIKKLIDFLAESVDCFPQQTEAVPAIEGTAAKEGDGE